MRLGSLSPVVSQLTNLDHRTGHLKWDIRRLSDPEQFHPRSYNTSFDGEHALPSGQPVTDGGSRMVLVGDWVLVVMTGNAKNFICVFAWDWVTCEIKFVGVLAPNSACLDELSFRIRHPSAASAPKNQ